MTNLYNTDIDQSTQIGYLEARRRLELYNTRLNEMLHLAKDWEADFHPDPQVPPPDLSKLLREFHTFSRAYLKFMRDTVERTHQALPTDKVNQIVRRVQEEWATISQASTQRKIPEYAHYLDVADHFAKFFYDLFLGNKVGAPITYFEKIYAINRYIFSHYPIISIPLVNYSDPTRWQALAHEMGHHIYWNSTHQLDFQAIHERLQNEVLRALLTINFASASPEEEEKVPIEDIGDLVYKDFDSKSKLVRVWDKWLEETFADVCGTLLAGPAFVDSCFLLQEERAATPTELLEDDGEHPMSYVRPLIAIETLRWISRRRNNDLVKAKLDELNKVINQFQNDWETKFKKILGDKTETDMGSKLVDIEQTVSIVVKTILGGSNARMIWVKPDGQDGKFRGAHLGELFNYNWWLEQLPEIADCPPGIVWKEYVTKDEPEDIVDFKTLRLENDKISLYERLRQEAETKLPLKDGELLDDISKELREEQIEMIIADQLLSTNLSERKGFVGYLRVIYSGGYYYSPSTQQDWNNARWVYVKGAFPGPYSPA